MKNKICLVWIMLAVVIYIMFNLSPQTIFYILTPLISTFTAYLLYISYKENRDTNVIKYLQLIQPIIERHHTEEITNLRREILCNLKIKAEEAKNRNSLLVDTDKEMQGKASALANYYEGIGMLLQIIWGFLPADSKDIILQMFHNSVSKTWPIYREYQDVIYPTRPKDWAESYKWLYEEVSKYRQNNKLNE